MTEKDPRELLAQKLDRRKLLEYGAAAGVGAALLRGGVASAQDANQTGIDVASWTPENIMAQAGTIEVDTAAEVSAIVPLDHEGEINFWYAGPIESDPQVVKDNDAAFWEAFGATYPNIKVNIESINYNEMLDKARTAALGGAAPHAARMPILWGVEFAGSGQFMELAPEDLGYPTTDYWPGAMKSVTWDGRTWGVPSNNETMALIWNADLFSQAGLEPESPPATWDDLVVYSKTIKDTTGKDGYGMVARVNAGNTPFRYMPANWAFGGGALDEAEAAPTYESIYVNNDGSRAALQAHYDMYVRDKSVPVSALTNTQTENANPFIAGNLGMMIAHPSEYAKMVQLAAEASGDDQLAAQAVVEGMRYGYIPEGPARRAVVFGGSNFHIFNPDIIDGGMDDAQLGAVRALAAFTCGPEWSLRLNWTTSNPSNVRGFKTTWMKERLETIKFLDVTTSMLPYGVPFPVIPEAPEIMNIIIPEMLQNALTESMSVEEATDDAASKIEELMSGI